MSGNNRGTHKRRGRGGGRGRPKYRKKKGQRQTGRQFHSYHSNQSRSFQAVQEGHVFDRFRQTIDDFRKINNELGEKLEKSEKEKKRLEQEIKRLTQENERLNNNHQQQRNNEKEKIIYITIKILEDGARSCAYGGFQDGLNIYYDNFIGETLPISTSMAVSNIVSITNHDNRSSKITLKHPINYSKIFYVKNMMPYYVRACINHHGSYALSVVQPPLSERQWELYMEHYI
jgi:hypothetical protein